MTYFNLKKEGDIEPKASATTNVDELGTGSATSMADQMHAERQLAQRFLRKLMVTCAKLHNLDLDHDDLADADLIPRIAREGNLTEREAIVDILRIWDALNPRGIKIGTGCDHAE